MLRNRQLTIPPTLVASADRFKLKKYMALDISKPNEIIQIMERHIASIRPEPNIRHRLDLGYELTGNSVFLVELRPAWNNPCEIQKHPYAKATFVKSKKIWKIYWMRANLKWYPYDPMPIVYNLEAFLKIVDEDAYGCFKG